MIDVRMEKIPPSMSERKTARPTVMMVKGVLESLGLQPGVWKLRVWKRIRKKSDQRFKAIQVDHAGGSRVILLMCKPGNNETGYEYHLTPPAFCDIHEVFRDLSSVHPRTLNSEIHRSDAVDMNVAKGLVDHMIELPEGISAKKPEKENIKATEIHEKFDQKLLSLEICSMGKETVLSEQAVMERALMVIGFCAGEGLIGGFKEVIDELQIENFLKSSTVYSSLEGAMRALVNGLCSEGLIEREKTRGGEVKGYRLTKKGLSRFGVLKAFLGEELKKHLSSLVIAPEPPAPKKPKKEKKAAEPVQSAPEVAPQQEDGESLDDYLQRLQSHVEEVKSYRDNVQTIKNLIAEAEGEKAESLRALEALENQRKDLERRIAEKEEDIKAGRAELSLLEQRRAEIEASRLKIN